MGRCEVFTEPQSNGVFLICATPRLLEGTLTFVFLWSKGTRLKRETT